MYLSGHHEPGLGSLRKKLKKVAKAAVHVGAAVFTGGASLAVSAAMINAKKQKAAQAAANAETARQEQAILAQFAAPQPAIAPAVMSPSAGGLMPMSIAPMAAPQSFRAEDAAYGPAHTPSTTPSWLVPAAIGGVVLLAVTMRGGRQ